MKHQRGCCHDQDSSPGFDKQPEDLKRQREKSAEKVVERTQEALLKAKANGKNQTCILND
ncbi:MAG: hypothetical protein A2351_04545 [Omnitrophica bacterium RIFOXYB12_FULL_50_7]|nr:MAG: hypothetical protein A2351_04545 [Omnitrophica bacterium RIFOXYB12_FULL_50_7]